MEEFVADLLEDEGLAGVSGKDIRAGEVEFLAMAALLDLERQGLVWGGGEHQGGPGVRRILGWLGWATTGLHTPICAATAVPTVRLWLLAEYPMLPLETRWPNVTRLAQEAWTAHQAGLAVAAAATARVTVEEAVERGLGDLDPDVQPPDGAAARERALSARLEKVTRDRKLFQPMDRSATQAAVSAIRDLGNEVIHRAAVDDPALQEAFERLLPRALASLSFAVSDALRREGQA